MAGREDDSWHTEEIRLPGTEDDGPGAVFPGSTAVRTDRPATTERRGITRRERRQTITFLVFFSIIVVLGLLALAAYFGKLDFGVGSGKPAPLPTCPSTAPSLAPGAVSVNVYNASSRNGLAMVTMRAPVRLRRSIRSLLMPYERSSARPIGRVNRTCSR